MIKMGMSDQIRIHKVFYNMSSICMSVYERQTQASKWTTGKDMVVPFLSLEGGWRGGGKDGCDAGEVDSGVDGEDRALRPRFGEGAEEEGGCI